MREALNLSVAKCGINENQSRERRERISVYDMVVCEYVCACVLTRSECFTVVL